MDLRKKIQNIQKDDSLTPEQKSKELFKLMNPNIELTKPENNIEFNYNLEGCKHYKRGCLLQANCCGKFVPCRLCHDELLDHKINRFETKNMLCKHCNKIQPVSNKCIECNKIMAKYYCNICKFWSDDINKDIFHCNQCGLCRVGLQKDYYHCNTCNTCIKITMKNTHICLQNTMHSQCPICKEELFNSTKQVSIIKCGHSIHSKCLEEYTKNNYQCPLCKKSMTNMTLYWKQLDEFLQQQNMPEEYQNTISHIYCNDCEIKTFSKYHFLYNKCNKCFGYNTNIITTNDYSKNIHILKKLQKKFKNYNK